MTTVLTVGTFSLLHPGHVNLLRRCADLGDRVVVGLNTDEFVRRYKGRPPVMNYVDREAVLRAIRWVDAVVPNFGDEDMRPLVDAIRPDILAVGDDWRTKDYAAQTRVDAAFLDERWIKLVFIPYSYSTAGPSSSAIRAAI